MDDVEARVRALFAGPLDSFVASRNALAKELKAAGDDERSRAVASLRKPLVPAWVVNRLVDEEADEVGELVALGERLRSAQRRAVSGGDVHALREAMEERRRRVSDLTKRASTILEAAGAASGPHRDEIVATLEAAATDPEAGSLVLSGTLTKPLRPPATFGDGGLRVLEGGGEPAQAPETVRSDRSAERRTERKALERELAAAETKERRAEQALARARSRLEDVDRRRADAREAVRAAEAEHRGAGLERRRLASRLAKLGDA